jgi:exodeoxyribonuclease-3
MRIATWNVNGLRARLDFVLHWLRARQPDIVGLQEIKLGEEQLPLIELQSAGYQVSAYGQKSWNGVAILSRVPARVIQRGLVGQDELGARLLTAEIGDLSFTTVYIPNGKSIGHEDFARKLAWLEALAAHVETTLPHDRAAILCGDFNLCPDGRDSWNEDLLSGSIFHTDEERKRFRRILEAGFVDVFRHLHPDLREYSWWDYRGGAFHKREGLRIDFLLATPPAAARVQAAQIDRDYRKKKDGLTPSDHAPVIADLAD